MHVAVLGAGVTGVTTAYYLSERGFDVTIIDRADEVAAFTSHANGSQLSYSYTDSLAQPGFISRIPGLVLGLDPAIRVASWKNLSLTPWGLSFLAECTAEKAKANTLAVLDIALHSAALLDDLRASVDVDFAWRRPGKIAVIGTHEELEGAAQRAEWKRERGCDVRIIDYDEALALEPALDAMQQRFAGAVYSPDDEVGDACAFSQGLAGWLVENRSVDLRLGETVTALRRTRGKVKGAETDGGGVDADAVVVCLGPWSGKLLRPVGINPQIYPIRGYSFTLPAGEAAPSVSITSVDKRVVFSLLDDRVRIAGFADFLGYRTGADARRQRTLLDIARDLAPQAADYDAARKFEWGGFRPVTPNGRPLVGSTAVDGLYLNTGHGILGWTLACATAKTVAEAL